MMGEQHGAGVFTRLCHNCARVQAWFLAYQNIKPLTFYNIIISIITVIFCIRVFVPILGFANFSKCRITLLFLKQGISHLEKNILIFSDFDTKFLQDKLYVDPIFWTLYISYLVHSKWSKTEWFRNIDSILYWNIDSSHIIRTGLLYLDRNIIVERSFSTWSWLPHLLHQSKVWELGAGFVQVNSVNTLTDFSIIFTELFLNKPLQSKTRLKRTLKYKLI